MGNNNLSLLQNNQNKIDFDDFFGKEIYWSSKNKVDKIIDTIRHGEPEKLENGKKGGLTPEGEKQIERQVKKLKEFYKDEKITIFCDTSTQRIKETLEVLKDKEYGLKLEIIEDDKLSSSYKEGTTGEQDGEKFGEIKKFWQQQIKNKSYKNIVILGHSSFIAFIKSLTQDGYDTLLLDFDELDHGESMHTRLDSENNSKSVLDGKLIINFSNFSEIKKDLEKLGNKSLNSILNSNLDKNNVGNLLNNFFDRNFDFILNNFNEITNTDLKDFFIFKIYELLKGDIIVNKHKIGEKIISNIKTYENLKIIDVLKNTNIDLLDIRNFLDKIKEELKNREFKDLGNLLKIINSFKFLDKSFILLFIEKEQNNYVNLYLLHDNTEKDLYKIWKNKISSKKNIEEAEKVIKSYCSIKPEL